jgi:hypothetical protein
MVLSIWFVCNVLIVVRFILTHAVNVLPEFAQLAEHNWRERYAKLPCHNKQHQRNS